MDYITTSLAHLSSLLRPHTSTIALALAATLLITYGSNLSRIVKRFIKGFPTVVRLALFIVLCAFGYSYLTVRGTALIAWLLSRLDAYLLAPAVIFLFIVLGVLAERKHQI